MTDKKIIIKAKMVLKVKENPIKVETLSPEYPDKNLALYACGTCFAIVSSKDNYCWNCATDISKSECFSSDNLSVEYEAVELEKKG